MPITCQHTRANQVRPQHFCTFCYEPHSNFGLKKTAREGRIIIFIDESGISERPDRVSTWAPKGQTPVLQYSFTWKQLSAVAGISFWNIYFKLVQGAVRAPEVVAFLRRCGGIWATESC